MKNSVVSKFTAAATVAGLMAVAALASAQATLPLYEPFNYAAGNLVNGTNGVNGGTWTQTGSNTAAPVQVVSSSLAYPQLPAGQGGKVVLGNGTSYQDVGLDVTTQTTGQVYASFILNVLNPGNTTGDYFFHFSSPGTSATDFRARVFVRQSATSSSLFNVGLRFTGTDTIQWSTDYPVGTPIFVVASYHFTGGDDMAHVWVNPATGSSEPASDLTATATGADLTNLGRVGLRQGSGNTSLQLEVDELRVSSSWADVTPSNANVRDWTLY